MAEQTKKKNGNAPRYDWDAINRDYRTGMFTDTELCRQYGCSRAALAKRIKRNPELWVRDQTDAVRQATNAKLIKVDAEQARVTKGLQSGVTDPNVGDAIDGAAETRVAVLRDHRQDIGNGRSLVNLLMGQLQEAAENRAEIEDGIEGETGDDNNPRRRNQMLRAVALPGHAGTLRDLTTAMKNLIGLERQAFNLDEKAGEASDLESVLNEVASRNASLVKDDDE